jgi:hypothetical protein
MKPKRRLTDEQIREIRNNPLPSPVMSKHYGVAPKTIRQIRTREIYKDVGEKADE